MNKKEWYDRMKSIVEKSLLKFDTYMLYENENPLNVRKNTCIISDDLSVPQIGEYNGNTKIYSLNGSYVQHKVRLPLAIVHDSALMYAVYEPRSNFLFLAYFDRNFVYDDLIRRNLNLAHFVKETLKLRGGTNE